MEKTFGEQGSLSQSVVRIVNDAARDQEEMEMEAEAEHRRGEGDQQSEINVARGKQPDRDSVEQGSISSRSRRTGSTEAEAYLRSTSIPLRTNAM